MPDATFTSLFGTDLLLHYDVTDSASLFTDTGGTSAASNGNEVKCLKPQLDAALQVNLTNANGPIYRSNYSSTGYAALEFDGVNDALVNTSTGLTSTRFFTLSVITPISTQGTIWNRGSTVANMARTYWNGSAGSYLFQSLGGTNDFGTNFTLATGKICIATVLGSDQSQIDSLGFSGGRQNHVLSSSIAEHFNVGVSNFSGFTQFGNFAFHEMLLIGADCEWGQVLRGAKILRNKWGITDPNGTPQAGGTSRPSSPFLSQVIG